MMCKMRIWQSLFLALFGVTVAQGQEKYTCVVVQFVSGENTEWMISEKPKMKQLDDRIVFYNDVTSVEYNTVDVAKLYFSKDGTGIVQNGVDKQEINFDSMMFRLKGFLAGETVSVYAADGKLQTIWTISKDGSLTLPVTAMAQGVNIVKVQNKSFKIVRK